MLVVGLVEEIRLAHFPPTPFSSAAVGSKIPGTKKRIGCSCRLGGVSLLSRTTGPLIQGVSQIASLGNKINCLGGGLYLFFFFVASLASFVYVRVFTPVISGKLGFFFRWISTGDRFLLLGACGVSPIEAGARRYPFLDLTCKGWPWRVFTTRNFVTSDDLQTLCNFPCATRNVTPTVSTGGKLWDHSTCLVKDS